ncbi:disease resistance protein RUN1-like [Corylus avellana]|uniref:disease resistance protein RUN1-like n=1 Tax=Corylus avellana TaxID=13451 RepID=UPI00286BB757|nr:disease resistance protein RUN1-like [Corylus avellana]
MAIRTSRSPEAIFSSSSSPHSNWIYDVFLCFRGEDTRKNFTDHLYFALRDAGIKVFKDDNELRRGQYLASELIRAIQGSRISIIIFSRNYAASRWCLEELVEIMECRRTLKQLVLPIFYDVEPSDVRNQMGTFAEAFAKHEEHYLLDMDKVLKWRRALCEAANLSGWDLRKTADGHEAKFIRKIVEEISRELKNTHLFIALYPVGVDSHVQEITFGLNVGANDIRMVGILGMGGIGKTTIAKAIYNQFFHGLEGKSYLANVRETSKEPRGQVHLQEQLLSDILKTSEIKISSVDRGINMIKERLCNKAILVILDDVDQMEQLNAICRRRDWFGLGSRIIITTRDERLLEELEVDSVYRVTTMNDIDSLELFSWHAFRNNYPIEDYTYLSRSVVAYCGGLPLALEVLGSFLFSRSMLEWKSALDKLKRIPHEQIQNKLRISFDGLSDNTEKDIFLDISCFFIGKDIDYVVKILDGCGFFAKIGISVLIQRCLLKVSETNEFTMHDLLRDMGREIVREKHPNKPGKWSRLWLHEDAFDILTKHEGTNSVEGLTLELTSLSKMNFNSEAFMKMQRLRLLQLDHVRLTGDYKYLSKELRWLCWHGFPLKFIPKDFYPRNLVVIDLQYSNLKKVWESPKLLEKMKILNLSHSHYLSQTPDFSKLPNLEQLILEDCTSLLEVHHSIGDLSNLVLVNLKDCKCLKSLPNSFYNLKSLETLILSGCSKMHNLADNLGEMESLTTLLVDRTAIRQVPFSIVQLKNLKYLSLCGCKGSPPKSLPSLFWSWISPRKSPKSVNLLPAALQGLNSLTHLCLWDCNLSDDGIPIDLWNLCSLKILDLRCNSFESLSTSLGGLSKLEDLRLDRCRKLKSISDLPASLIFLDAKHCTALERMPDLSKLSNMNGLNLTNCHKLVEIPGLDKRSNSIVSVGMEGCMNLTYTFKQSFLQEWVMPGVGKVFGIVLPGNQIPDWFTFQCEGPSVHFKVPTTDHILKGFGVCFVYAPCVQVLSSYKGSMSFINHTKNTILTNLAATIGGPLPLGDHLLLRNIGLTNDFEDGDEVEALVDWGPEIIVKTIGIYLVYERVVDGKDKDHAIVVSDDEDDNNNIGNRCSCKRKMRSPNMIDDSQTLMKEKKLKKLATEENEYSFYSFVTRCQKFPFE